MLARGPASRVVIVGGSIAGLSAARELRGAGFRGHLTVVDQDEDAPYRRPDVSKLLLSAPPGGRTRLGWPDELAVERLVPATATGLDLGARTISITGPAGPAELAFDGLVIATGCRARPLRLDGLQSRVHTLRSLADAARLRARLATSQHVGVVGGGFLGLEVAAHVVALGKRATVVEYEKLPMARQLGAEPATLLVDLLARRGVQFRLGSAITAIADRGRFGSTLVLPDGPPVEVDVVLVAVGAVAQTEWLHGNGLDLTDGVLCDEHGAVLGAPDVVACGDVASWRNPLLGRRARFEHWNSAIEQGIHAARRLLGTAPDGGLRSLPYFWSDQGDLKVQMLGSAAGHDEVAVVERNEDSFLAEYRRAGEPVAVAGVNVGRRVMAYRSRLIATLERDRLPATTPG
jgi:NADPH-dependent 2,4-dienoyl-CoA reductase/sulfur reductase-like enzyme